MIMSDIKDVLHTQKQKKRKMERCITIGEECRPVNFIVCFILQHQPYGQPLSTWIAMSEKNCQSLANQVSKL